MDKIDEFSAQSDVDGMAKAIIEVISVAKVHEVDLFLMWGALLGMIRENRLLPWNNDAELGCLYSSNIFLKFKLIVDDMNKLGYSAYYYSSNGSIAIRSNNVIVNINCFWFDGDYAVRPHETGAQAGYAPFCSRISYWIGTLVAAYPSGLVKYKQQPLTATIILKSSLVTLFRLFPNFLRKKLFLSMIAVSEYLGANFHKTAYPSIHFKEFKEIEFYGSKVMIPQSPQELIECIYGAGWNVPQENWSFYDKKNGGKTGVVFKKEKWNYNKVKMP